MTPKEIVLGGYKLFAEGDMQNLSKINHKNAVMKVNGDYELSGEYRGFDDFLNNFLATRSMAMRTKHWLALL
jgi:ketosteroid isomerase-like protein